MSHSSEALFMFVDYHLAIEAYRSNWNAHLCCEGTDRKGDLIQA
jgi:hypothetical protein